MILEQDCAHSGRLGLMHDSEMIDLARMQRGAAVHMQVHCSLHQRVDPLGQGFGRHGRSSFRAVRGHFTRISGRNSFTGGTKVMIISTISAIPIIGNWCQAT